jgi:activator of HSP90 ATPase
MKNFRKYFYIPAEPELVYQALTNEATIQLWTGEEATMSKVPGSEFSLWSGNIVGKNLEFEEGVKIVQQWYFEGQQEESIVTIKLHSEKRGTSMEIRQINIPDEAYDDIVEGWHNTYIAELLDFYEGE